MCVSCGERLPCCLQGAIEAAILRVREPVLEGEGKGGCRGRLMTASGPGEQEQQYSTVEASMATWPDSNSNSNGKKLEATFVFPLPHPIAFFLTLSPSSFLRSCHARTRALSRRWGWLAGRRQVPIQLRALRCIVSPLSCGTPGLGVRQWKHRSQARPCLVGKNFGFFLLL